MNGARIQIEAADGTIPCRTYHPPIGEARAWPAVVYLMDGMGIRPTLLGAAEKLAGEGFYVLVPDLYYRGRPYAPFDHSTLQDDPVEQQRVMGLVKLVTNDGVMRDLRAFFDFFDRQAEVQGSRVGCVGYCMGGPLALYAAGTFPERVTAAASIHGANLATDRPDSPHLLAEKMTGELYLGVAEHDPYIIPGETERIDAALREAGASYRLERYPGCHHGFALPGAHGYDTKADGLHRQRIVDLFRRNLG
ncbi:MAG: dienelactone hydrolase family protein [Deltaproteobacteria bacterium]|nr:dienelactone hydrolase family protein [Deltaproteobacteria bacterium]